MPAPPERSPSLRPASPIVLWKDVFAVFDDGTYTAQDYAELERQLSRQNVRFPCGLGCIVVIPPGAKRIQPDTQAEIDRVLNAISVRCLCWAVIEQGFRGATIRATLATLSLVGRRKKYPTHVASTLEEALSWTLPRLDGGQIRLLEAEQPLGLFDTQLRAFAREPRGT